MFNNIEKHLGTYILHTSISLVIFTLLTLGHSFINDSPLTILSFLVPEIAGITVGLLMARNHILFEQVNYLANTDILTGICNRQYFDKRLREEADRAARYKQKFSILYIDIDHFKLVNDRYGHATGDHILIEFSRLITQYKRESDLFARFGGEEFILLIHMASKEEASEAYIRIQKAMAKHDFSPLDEVTFSAGIAEFNSQHNTIKSLLDRADQALYEAKSCGRNRAVIAE